MSLHPGSDVSNDTSLVLSRHCERLHPLWSVFFPECLAVDVARVRLECERVTHQMRQQSRTKFSYVATRSLGVKRELGKRMRSAIVIEMVHRGRRQQALEVPNPL